jgi:hypothetical protein
MKPGISIAVLVLSNMAAIGSAKAGHQHGGGHAGIKTASPRNLASAKSNIQRINTPMGVKTASPPKFMGGSLPQGPLIGTQVNPLKVNGSRNLGHHDMNHGKLDTNHGKNPSGVIVDPIHPSGPSRTVISDPVTIFGNGAGAPKGFHPPLGTVKPVTNTPVMTGGTTSNGNSPSRPDYIWDGDHWVRSTSGQIYTPIPVRDHRGANNPDRGGGVTVTPGTPHPQDVTGSGGSVIDDVINYFFAPFPHGKLDTAGTTRDHRSGH